MAFAPPRARGLKPLLQVVSIAVMCTFAPPRARGLKHCKLRVSMQALTVRAPTGAWIETTATSNRCCACGVRAPTGAWIETLSSAASVDSAQQFAPPRARGLKQLIRLHWLAEPARSRPHGRVD